MEQVFNMGEGSLTIAVGHVFHVDGIREGAHYCFGQNFWLQIQKSSSN